MYFTTYMVNIFQHFHFLPVHVYCWYYLWVRDKIITILKDNENSVYFEQILFVLNIIKTCLWLDGACIVHLNHYIG